MTDGSGVDIGCIGRGNGAPATIGAARSHPYDAT
jgi:hypothetical protein